MPSALTFIIPVRHQDNCKDWSLLKSNLAETIRSISSQLSDDWNAVIVANHGADLPPLPAKFDVAWVDFPPNQLHEKGAVDMETFYDAFRIDKGRRVLAGMCHAGKMGHVMITDDDDFVSNRLASFVAEHRQSPGWCIAKGYAWQQGASLLFLSTAFHKLCGTSHIIRADLYEIPKQFSDATPQYIRQMLGSHVFIDGYLEGKGTPLAPLPFPGAIYRIGHAGAHSKSQGVISQLFLKKELLKKPVTLFLRLFQLRLMNDSVRKEFLGIGYERLKR